MFEFGPLWLVDGGAGAGAFGPAWAGLMASLGLGGALAGRVRLDRSATRAVFVALLLGGTTTLLVSSHTVVVTVAQIVVAVLSVVIGIFLTRVLHDAVASDVRSGVASGVGAATWAIFIPFAIGFGAVSERWSVHVAGWMLVALVVAIASLLATVTSRAAAGEPNTTSAALASCQEDDILGAATARHRRMRATTPARDSCTLRQSSHCLSVGLMRWGRAVGARGRGADTRPAGCCRRRCCCQSSRGRRPGSRRRRVLILWRR